MKRLATAFVSIFAIVLLLFAITPSAQATTFSRSIELTVYSDHVHTSVTGYVANSGVLDCIRNSFVTSAVVGNLSRSLGRYGVTVSNFDPNFGGNNLQMSFDVEGTTIQTVPVVHAILWFSWQAGSKYTVNLSYLSGLTVTLPCSSGSAEGRFTFDFSYAAKPTSTWAQPDSGSMQFISGNNYAHIGVDKPWWAFLSTMTLSPTDSVAVVYSNVGWP